MPFLRGVLDANVLSTAIRSRRGPANRLLDAATAGRFEMIMSSYLLEEVRETLDAVFRIPPAEVAVAVRFVSTISTMVEPTSIPPISRDPNDDPILALAMQSGAAFLATYDHDLMAVGSVGVCGVIHPMTALLLVGVRPLAAEDSGGGVSLEDRADQLAYVV